MDSKIELFKLILERTELCRVSFNAKAQVRYSSRKYLGGKHTLNQLNVKLIQAKKANDAVKAFTKKTTTRRRQLAHALKTCQNKSANNTISNVKVGDKVYSIKEMKSAIQEYEIEQILLGGSSE